MVHIPVMGLIRIKTHLFQTIQIEIARLLVNYSYAKFLNL